MKQTSEKTTAKQTRYVLLTVLVVMLVILAVALLTCYKAVTAETHARYVGFTNVAAEKIAKTVRGMEMNAMVEFDEVEKHLDSPEAVIAALFSKTDLNPDVRGYFAAFEPDFFPEKGTWFEPYVHHSDTSDFVMTQVGSARHNYHKSDWYIRAKKSNENFWSDPYYYYDGTNISGHYTTFVRPIYDAEGQLACVCGADMTFEWLSKELQRIDKEYKNDELMNGPLTSDADFYTVVINVDGSCVAHPEGKNVTLKDESLIRDLEQQKSDVVDMEIDGVPSTVYYGPIDHVNWSVAVVVPKQSMVKPVMKTGLILLLVAVAGMIVVWLVCRRREHVEETV